MSNTYVESRRAMSLALATFSCLLLANCGSSPPESADSRATVNSRSTGPSPVAETTLWSAEPNNPADWTRMSGPVGDHRSPARGLNWDWPEAGPPRAWSAECGSGYGMPVVSDGRTMILAKEDDKTSLTALSINDGLQEWRWDAAPAAYTDDYEDYSDGPYSTPTVQWGRVFAITGDGLLVVLDAANGDELARLDLLDTYNAPVGPFPWGTSPFAFEADGSRRVLINVGGPEAGVVCLDAETLATIWKTTDEGRSYATPRVFQFGDRLVAALLTAKNALLLDANDGSEIWSKTFGVSGDPKLRANSVSPMVVASEPLSIFFTAGPGAGLLCVEARSLDDVSAEMFGSLGRRTLDSQFNNLTHDGERLCGFTSKWNRQANLRCIRLSDGELLWEYDSDLQRGASIAVDGKLIVLGEDGHLALMELSADGPNVLYQSKEPLIEGPCYTAPVLANGRLLIRTEREVVCFDIRPESPEDESVDVAVGAIQSR